MAAKRDYYEVLGVNRNADKSELKKRIESLRKISSGHESGDAHAEQMFKEATEAYEVLSDPEKRKMYDQFGHAAFDGSASDSSREIREEALRIGNSILIMMTDQWTTFLEISLAECSMDLIREVLDPVRALQAAVVSAADLAAAGALTAEALAADFPEGRKALI